MSVIRRLITQIENLSVEQLCEALEYNGYGDFTDRFRNKSIDGQEFLKLTEVQISLWRLPTAQMRRLWSFIEHVRQNPSNFQLVPKKTSQVTTPPISNFNNSQNNFHHSHSLSRPPLKQKPKFTEQSKIENMESSKFSSLTKEDSKLVRGKLEQLFKGDPNRSSSFLYKNPLPPKSPINTYIEESYDDDDDSNDGYLPPINIEQANLRSPVVESKNTFLHKTRESYVNHNIESELQHPARPNYKKNNKRPLPPIPHEMVAKFDPPKFQNNQERQNLVPQKPGPKTASIFKRPIKPIVNERQRIEEPEEELDEYTAILADEEHVPYTRPLPEIPTEDDEDLAEYGTISEEEEELDTKFRFNPINQHPSFLSQLKSATNQKHKQNIVEEEELVYEPVLDVVEEKEMFVKPSINIRSRPLPPPPILPNRPNQRANEERLLPPVPVLSKRPNQRAENVSDSDEESVLSEVKKMSLAKPSRTPDKSRSPINLPKPPSMLPKPPQFGGLNSASSDVFVNKGTIPKDDFKKETYYRETDRRGARMILNNLEEGTFLVRPSRDDNYICTLSIMHHTKMFNVGVQRDRTTGFVTLGNIDVEQPDFRRLQDIINYYCVHPLCLSGQIIVLKNILPFERR